MVIWVHNICYARFVFNKFSFQKKTRPCLKCIKHGLYNGALYLDKSDYRSRMPFILLRISEL